MNGEWQQLEIEFPRGPRPERHPRLFDDGPLDVSSLGDEDQNLLERTDWYRASGDMICSYCHYTYREHRTIPGSGMTVLCNNRLVHL